MVLEERKKEALKEDPYSISKKLNIPPALADILIKRGYSSEESTKKFLSPCFSDLIDPFCFKEMDKAVACIKRAVSTGEKVYIYGDFDVDGTMATTILALELRNIGANVSCYIPDRHTEGYGLNNNAIKKLYEKGCRLLVTVDCGITGAESVKYAYSLGMKVIVTDHHEPPENIPACEAVLDARVPDETYPFSYLCGAGVSLKLVQALSGMEAGKKYIDLAALATVADIVPLIGENRVIVAEGLKFMNSNLRPGLRALSEYAMGGETEITSYHLGFRFAPMINACGRLGNAANSVRLMSTANMEKLNALASMLNDLNEKRKKIESQILEECIERIESNPMPKRKGIVICGKEWESGVIGIVASRLVDRYSCPVIVMTYEESSRKYHGSCRSINGINIHDVLEKCKRNIIKFGGHVAAAGLDVSESELKSFKAAFYAEVQKYPDEMFEPKIIYDTELCINDITVDLTESLKRIEPCGMGNPKVRIASKNVSLKNIKIIGANRDHYSCQLYDETGSCRAVAFRQKRPDEFLDMDVVFTPGINSYNGKKEVQCVLEYIGLSREHIVRNEASKNTSYGVRIIDQDLDVLGINPRKMKQFHNAGIYTIKQLANYLPKRYHDFRKPVFVRDLQPKEMGCVEAKIIKIKTSQKGVFATCVDDAGTVFMVSWFNQPYIAKNLRAHTRYIFCGTVNFSDDGFPMFSAKYYSEDIERLKILKPEYKKIAGMSDDYLTDCIKKALGMIPNVDYLDYDTVKQFGLMSEYDSTTKLHSPANDMDIRDAQRRKVFDDLFRFNFILKNKFSNMQHGSVPSVTGNGIWADLKKSLPYTLTSDQGRTLTEMLEYVKSGKRLNSLVQGDVGAGKTIVAFFMMALMMENGYQSCVIAPTEVLAKQHYDGLVDLMAPFGVKVGYLVGKMKAKEKRETLAGIKNGTVQMVVGTHAVIQDSVEFHNLGLAVIDEQHRFGVTQRDRLNNIKDNPHMITMSATPIPRTLSMALFGDNIQVFNIKTKPAGRLDVITIKAGSDSETNELMLREIRSGRQCYVVCPLIDESESEKMANVKSVAVEVESIMKYFENYPEVKVSNITGRMKQSDINEEIKKFADNETNILISTTIIEVGVNIPNATVMVIKSSERFGLAQAHQLRGRVGRGSHQSYCVLQPNGDDIKAEILCSTSDGFEIARQDLMLRGAGDYIGTQQTGSNRDVMLMMAEPELYNQISILNDEIYKDPARFAKYRYIIEEYERQKEE